MSDVFAAAVLHDLLSDVNKSRARKSRSAATPRRERR
jgi:hypothetical protein